MKDAFECSLITKIVILSDTNTTHRIIYYRTLSNSKVIIEERKKEGYLVQPVNTTQKRRKEKDVFVGLPALLPRQSSLSHLSGNNQHADRSDIRKPGIDAAIDTKGKGKLYTIFFHFVVASNKINIWDETPQERNQGKRKRAIFLICIMAGVIVILIISFMVYEQNEKGKGERKTTNRNQY